MTTLRLMKKRINPALEIFGVLLTMFDGRTNFSTQVAQEVRKHFHKIHDELAPRIQKPYPEAEEILRYAMAQGHKNYLYTHSGKIVKKLLEQWGIADCFEDIIDSTMDFPTKPAPDALNWLCEKHGLDKKDCMMIGDRDIDTDCGRNAGMKGCLFDPEHYYDTADVDYRIENLLELKNII